MLQSKRYEIFQVGEQRFEGAANAKPALPGDIVEVEGGRVATIVKRGNHKGLVGVLEVASKARYGFTKRGAPIYLFTPWNEAYPQLYVGSTVADTSKNLLVVVDVLDWDSTSNLPRGDCREVLGPCGDLPTEEAGLARHACPAPWKLKEVGCLAERAIPPLPPSRNMGTTFHVDPPGCRDIDDAITIWPITEEEWEVRIHIADVATLLATNPWLHKAASLGQTLYRDGAVVAGMLPAVAEEACSLLPHERRRTLTLAFHIFDCGIVFDVQWLYEEIVVTESYTYESVLDSAHAPALKMVATALKGSATHDPHEWIEQLMLFYNREAAAVLQKAKKGILRKHSEPDWNLLSRLEGYQQVGVPEYLAYRAGEYCAATDANPQHWGLDAELYTHASSPIRRWADCVNQTVLLNHLFSAGLPDLPGAEPAALNAVAKRGRGYERDLFFVRTLLGGAAPTPLGIVVEVNPTTKLVKVWVDAWKRLVHAKKPLDGWAEEPIPGEVRRLSVYYDPSARNWKRRMVLQLHLSSA
jgi:exoribonuclease R